MAGLSWSSLLKDHRHAVAAQILIAASGKSSRLRPVNRTAPGAPSRHAWVNNPMIASDRSRFFPQSGLPTRHSVCRGWIAKTHISSIRFQAAGPESGSDRLWQLPAPELQHFQAPPVRSAAKSCHANPSDASASQHRARTGSWARFASNQARGAEAWFCARLARLRPVRAVAPCIADWRARVHRVENQPGKNRLHRRPRDLAGERQNPPTRARQHPLSASTAP